MKQQPKSVPRHGADTEFSGSLAPDLDHPEHSKAHPFRYVGPDRANNAPRGQVPGDS